MLIWTESEEELLCNLANRYTVNKIASILGRSIHSVRSKAYELNISLSKKYVKWTHSKCQALCDKRDSGADWVEVSTEFGVSVSSAESIYYRYKVYLKSKEKEIILQRFGSFLDTRPKVSQSSKRLFLELFKEFIFAVDSE